MNSPQIYDLRVRRPEIRPVINVVIPKSKFSCARSAILANIFSCAFDAEPPSGSRRQSGALNAGSDAASVSRWRPGLAEKSCGLTLAEKLMVPGFRRKHLSARHRTAQEQLRPKRFPLVECQLKNSRVPVTQIV